MFEQTDTVRKGYFEEFPLKKQVPYLSADENLERKWEGIRYLCPKDDNECVEPEYLCSSDRCYGMGAEKRNKGNEDPGGNGACNLIRRQAFFYKVNNIVFQL